LNPAIPIIANVSKLVRYSGALLVLSLLSPAAMYRLAGVRQPDQRER